MANTTPSTKVVKQGYLVYKGTYGPGSKYPGGFGKTQQGHRWRIAMATQLVTVIPRKCWANPSK